MSEDAKATVLGDDFEAAVKALEEATSNRDVVTLQSALKSRSFTIRKCAAEALGKVGDRQSVRPLCDALENRWAVLEGTEVELYRRELVVAIVGALEKLTGQALGPIDPGSNASVQRVLDQVRRWLGPA